MENKKVYIAVFDKFNDGEHEVEIHSSLPLNMDKKEIVKLIEYIGLSEREKLANCKKTLVEDASFTRSLITILKYITPNVNYSECFSKKLLLHWKINQKSIKYQFVECLGYTPYYQSVFDPSNYRLEEAVDIFKAFAEMGDFSDKKLINNVICSSKENISFWIDKIKDSTGVIICNEEGDLYFSLRESKLDRVEKLKDLKAKGLCFSHVYRNKMSELIDFYESCGASTLIFERVVEELYTWADLGREEMESWSNDYQDWEYNID